MREMLLWGRYGPNFGEDPLSGDIGTVQGGETKTKANSGAKQLVADKSVLQECHIIRDSITKRQVGFL
jgi:hypothetical protein